MEKLLSLLSKHKSLITYGIFGVLTTLINIGIYALCYQQIGIGNVVSNIIAWVVAALFAFVTNKIWVFESKSLEPAVLVAEAVSFFGCRLATGVLDIVIMYVTVDMLALNSTIMKCISNVLVIIANYVASKFVIFKKGAKTSE